MKILVTGSEGSLAQAVIPLLLSKGHEVLGVDNNTRYGKIDRPRNYEFQTRDLCDTASVQGLFSDQTFDAVLHCAALVYGVVGFHSRPADILADNGLPVINLLKYGHAHIGKFVYISSSMVYERCTPPHFEPDTRDTPVMHTAYGFSKYVGERIVQAFHEQYGIATVIWRPFNVITPYETPEEVGYSHVFSDFIEKIIAQRQLPLQILGDGEQVRCFTNIHDVAFAIAHFSLDQNAHNQTFNLANLEPLTMKQVASLIVELGKQFQLLPDDYELTFEHHPIYDDDVRKRIPDVSKLQQTFKWVASTKVRASLEECIRHRFPLATK